MGLTLLAGRALTPTDVRLGLPVAVLGVGAAAKLQLVPLSAGPVVSIGSTPVTVIGIADSALRNQDLLTGVIVPEPLAARLSGAPVPPETVIVTTLPGAARQVGVQEPIVLDPNHPGDVQAVVPPDPNTLRRTVTGPVRALDPAGRGHRRDRVLSIGNVASLSVVQRTAEIGVRRAVGGSRRDIFVMILTEALFVGGLSGLLGSAIGVFVVAAVSVHQHWEAVIAPTAPLAAPSSAS